MKSTLRFGICITLLLGLGMCVPASAALYSFSGAANISGPGDFVGAIFFTANQDLNITAIGLYDVGGDGISQNHGYRLYNASTSSDLLVTTFAAGSGTLAADGFRYVNISPIAISAGTQLILLADNRSGSNTDMWRYDLTGISINPAVTITKSVFENGSTISNLNPSQSLSQPGDILAGPNLLFDAAAGVPEPATWILIISGLGLMAIRKR